MFMKIALIAAMDQNRAIGYQGSIPWNLPEDLKFFRNMTRGHPVIMGRSTYESIGKLLPKRENIILTRNPDYPVSGAETYASLEAAFETLKSKLKEDDMVFVIGGGQIYEQALPYATHMYVTYIHQTFDGDAFFPSWNAKEWKETWREDHLDHVIPHSYVLLERISG